MQNSKTFIEKDICQKIVYIYIYTYYTYNIYIYYTIYIKHIYIVSTRHKLYICKSFRSCLCQLHICNKLLL